MVDLAWKVGRGRANICEFIFFLIRTANIGKGRNTKRRAGTKVTKT